MLDELFGKVEASFESYDDHLENWGCIEEGMGDGDIAYSSGGLAAAKTATEEAKEKLKESCHKFFSETIWVAQLNGITLAELLAEDEQLAQQWSRVEEVVKDNFPEGTLWEICCK